MSADATPTNERLPTAKKHLDPGDVLNERYRIERLLASGGYGDVLAAFDLQEGRKVALKILRADAGNNDPSAIARMRQEAEILRIIDHPHIVRVFGVETTLVGEAMVMELIEGQAIDQLLMSEGPGTPDRIAPIVAQLLSALDAAHAKGILHRDIKPENIILSRGPDGEIVKLVDFGIAKASGTLGNNELGVTLVQTRSGGFIGTPRYCAPEQAIGDDLGPQVDLFALGLVIAEWLTGNQRLNAERHADVMAQLLGPDVIDVSDCPPPWNRWLEHMVNKDVRKRPSTAREAYDSLVANVVNAHRPADFVDTEASGYGQAAPSSSFLESEDPLELDFDRVERVDASGQIAVSPPSASAVPEAFPSAEYDLRNSRAQAPARPPTPVADPLRRPNQAPEDEPELGLALVVSAGVVLFFFLVALLSVLSRLGS